jgi:hypothetical protein
MFSRSLLFMHALFTRLQKISLSQMRNQETAENINLWANFSVQMNLYIGKSDGRNAGTVLWKWISSSIENHQASSGACPRYFKSL